MEKRHLYQYDSKKAYNYVLKVDKHVEQNCIKKNLDFDNKFVNLSNNHKAHTNFMVFQNGKDQKENKKEEKNNNSGNGKTKINRIPTFFKASNK